MSDRVAVHLANAGLPAGSVISGLESRERKDGRGMKSGRVGNAGRAADAPRVLEGATHLLVSTVGESDVVHVLGRRTTIGRTADNDLRIDSEAISRHHAVIVCGPINAVVEDLGSTNGVQVNGQRVRRQVLRDGDALTLGRAQFRFVVRAPPAPVTGRGPLR
jgi:hypothetical protein